MVDKAKKFEPPRKGSRDAGALKRLDLKYPLDDTDYKGRLVFELLEEESDNKLVQDATREATIKSHQDGIEQINASKERIKTNLAAERAGELDIKGISSQDYQAQGRRIMAQQDEVTSEVSDRIKFLEGGGYDDQTQKLGPNFDGEITIPPTLDQKVSIYLPMALNFRDNVSYENTDLGTLGAAAEGGLNQPDRGILTGIMEGAGGTLASVFKSGSDLGTLAALQLNVTNKVLGEGVKAAARQAAGVTLNPNTRSLFKSVAIREFAFQFKFIAKSKQEADEVRKIVKFFRTELYPESITVDVGDTKVAIGYKFPRKFVLTPMYNNQPITDTRILPCYLRDVSVVYNPTNQIMHGGDDPHFTEIDMSLAFTETRTLTREEIDMDGGY